MKKFLAKIVETCWTKPPKENWNRIRNWCSTKFKEAFTAAQKKWLPIRNRYLDFQQDHEGSCTMFKTGVVGLLGLSAISAGMASLWTAVGVLLPVAGFFTVLAGASAAFTGVLYAIETSENKRIDTAINEAGQKIQGPFWAIYRLEKAQNEILYLTRTFNQASAIPADVQKEIDILITASAKPLQEITVLEAGTQGADKNKYQFIKRKSEPVAPLPSP